MDLRHALRSIRKMPLLSAVVVVSLGIGIGVNTAVFSWIQALVLRRFPAPASRSPIEPAQFLPGVSWPE
jgi:hypothetical protein